MPTRAGWTICLQFEVMQQYGFDPNAMLTSEGRLVLPDGGDVKQVLADGSDDTSTSVGDSLDSSEDSLNSVEKPEALERKVEGLDPAAGPGS